MHKQAHPHRHTALGRNVRALLLALKPPPAMDRDPSVERDKDSGKEVGMRPNERGWQSPQEEGRERELSRADTWRGGWCPHKSRKGRRQTDTQEGESVLGAADPQTDSRERFLARGQRARERS